MTAYDKHELVIGKSKNLPGGAKYSGRDWKKWLQVRSAEWKIDEGQKEAWHATCMSRYGRVPETKEMSIQEMEECLQICGDDEVVGMRAMTEALYEGTVGRIMTDYDSGDAF